MKAKLTKTITAIFLFAIPVLGFGQIAPDLKSAADFAVLAATGISFDGDQTVINTLDIGLYPGTSISGNYSLVGGVALTSTTDPTNRLVPAKQDLLNAYLFAEASTVPAPTTISGNQGGLTLAPGIYKSTSTLAINDTPLTLDADGDENAVWIFQIASSLTTTVGGSVILAGGAKANNVYWQVGSSATIGNDTEFYGNILALVDITVNTGATLYGRALARNGAVTFAGDGTMYKPEESQAASGALTITKTADPTTFSAEGDLISYEIVVTNTGNVALENITVEDDLTGLSELIASLGPGVSETFTTSHNTTATDFQNGFVVNIATAVTEDISESASAYVIVTKEGLLITKVATPKTYYAIGQVIDYDIVVENIGTVTVTNIIVTDDLTVSSWPIASLGPGESQILETSYTIIESDMLHGSVDNTATATVSDTTVSDTESVLRVDPPPPVPLTTWAIVLGGILIAGFVVFQYRRSTPKSV
jgi:uncharacterized repeat protein (TIGR01451 family)